MQHITSSQDELFLQYNLPVGVKIKEKKENKTKRKRLAKITLIFYLFGFYLSDKKRMNNKQRSCRRFDQNVIGIA